MSEGSPEVEVINTKKGLSPGLKELQESLRKDTSNRKVKSKGLDPANTALWIDGKDYSGSWDEQSNIERVVDRMTRPAKDRISAAESELARCHTKRIKGVDYWYKWVNDAWKYCGKEDPRPELEARVEQLQIEHDELEARLRSCVIRPMGKHLVIDVVKFQEHINKKLPKNMIRIQDVLEVNA